MPQKPPVRMLLVAAALLLCMTGMIVQLFAVLQTDHVAEAGVRQGQYHLHVPLADGLIYDRNFSPINGAEVQHLAVAVPTPETVSAIFAQIRDRDAVSAQIQSGVPFVCALNAPVEPRENLYLLEGRTDPDGPLPAQHLLGYIQNGSRVAGLQLACADWLAQCDTAADLTFTVSGTGAVLAGAESSIVMQGYAGGGIVTALDLPMQRIAEQALADAAFSAGAAVVMDVETGDLLACASTPVYDPQHLADALDDPQTPFLSRALSAYAVGSVFKLVIASAALEQGFSPLYMNTCTGAIDIHGQIFRCHRLSGHGLLNMEQALIQSCNPYFISLTRVLPADLLHDTADALGFGREMKLADGLFADSGLLQSAEALEIPAEKANFSFGQGKLLATPLQVAAMTACIANGGIYTAPRLVLGMTRDGKTIFQHEESVQRRALSQETADAVRDMMTAVIAKSEQTNGRPDNITAGGKTSTAQTGQYGADGTEYCHAWMTGFFPAEHPQYAVTVFGENAGSGNAAAAPVFRSIIEQIAAGMQAGDQQVRSSDTPR